jgi:hypothetical protein
VLRIDLVMVFDDDENFDVEMKKDLMNVNKKRYFQEMKMDHWKVMILILNDENVHHYVVVNEILND